MKYVNVQGKLDSPIDPGSQSVPTPLAQRVAAVSSTAPNQLETSEYLLVCTATSTQLGSGSWYFSLESANGQQVLEAQDEEAGDLNRLTLLAAVRGLEAIDGSSAVTLLSHNRYLIRSLADSLPRWRENNFVWEHFGRRIEVQHAGLWRRIDHALSIHRVEACLVSSRLVSRGINSPAVAAAPAGSHTTTDNGTTWRVDSAHSRPRTPASARPSAPDRLRQWLLRDASANHHPTMKSRFTAADLMEAV